jgi:hypothetical protein
MANSEGRSPRCAAMWKAITALAVVAVAGCGDDRRPEPSLPKTAPSVGPTRSHRPPSLSVRAARGEPIGALRCTRGKTARFGVHLELFAARRVVLIPPGIGIAPPRRRAGAYVSGGRCSYPLRTREPTGVIEVDQAGRTKELGQFFAVWGQPLRGRAYVNGRPWRRDPRAIPLARHAQIVLEAGGYVRPHASYRFPPGL